MLSLHMRDSATDYTLYVESKKRNSFKIDLGLDKEDEDISDRLIDMAVKMAKPKFIKICTDLNVLYLGYSSSCIVMLDAKKILEGANNYLESCSEKGKKVPKITHVVVTDKLPEQNGKKIPEVHPTRWSEEKGFRYIHEPNYNSSFDTEKTNFPCIYYVNPCT